MFPIGDDHIKGGSPPVLSWIFIAANVLVFFYEVSLGPDLQQFIFDFGAVPGEITNGENLHTLLTSMFLHGGWAHLIGNMLFLYVFGDNIEAAMGNIKYFFFYAAGGLAASFAHILTNPESTIPSVGASGAISAVLGAYVVMFPKSKVRVLFFIGFYFTTFRVTAVFFLGFWILQQFLYGIADLNMETAQTSGVAWWAHIGGFVFGLIFDIFFRKEAKKITV